jgi:hypothetical protein
MPNILIICLEGFSASARQLFPSLLPKALSRANVHESITPEDALNYIGAGWPSIILTSDPAVVEESNKSLLKAIINWVKHGCTWVLMGFFSSTIDFDELNRLFKEDLGLRWRVAEYSSHDVRLLHTVDKKMIRPASLVREFQATAVYLGHVPTSEVVYAANSHLAYAAFARFELGKIGYVGDGNFGEEPERLILAMCHLDRPEDSLQVEQQL